MSQQNYHWEALRRQRVNDRKHAAHQRMMEEERKQEEFSAEEAARDQLQSQQEDFARRRKLAEEVEQRDKRGIRNSYKEREEQIKRLMKERSWHDDMISKMDQQEKDALLKDLLRDHAQKSKVLRDHGLYRGDATFFIDPQYN